jgi:hypothetical protein
LLFKLKLDVTTVCGCPAVMLQRGTAVNIHILLLMHVHPEVESCVFLSDQSILDKGEHSPTTGLSESTAAERVNTTIANPVSVAR